MNKKNTQQNILSSELLYESLQSAALPLPQTNQTKNNLPPSPAPSLHQCMTAASICFDFINSAARIMEMGINIDTPVPVIMELTMKYQF